MAGIKGSQLIAKHPGRVPVICKPHEGVELTRTKFLVDGNTIVGNFMAMIRSHVKVNRFEAVYLLVNNTLIANNRTFFDVYHEHKDEEDEMVYIHIRKEATFG